MANKAYINLCKNVKKQNEMSIPAVYASIAMVLSDGGLQYEHIADIFSKSQNIMCDANGDLLGILVKCYNKTGIQVMTEKQYQHAEKLGLINPEEYENGKTKI